MTEFYKLVGPNLKKFWEELRTDVDADEKGGVMTTVGMFFPSDYVLDKIKDQKRKRLTLDLFVILETYLTEIQTSLQMFEQYNRDYDEYCLRLSNSSNLIRDNVVNWHSKFQSIKNEFEKMRKRCQIDSMLLDQEDELDDYDDEPDA